MYKRQEAFSVPVKNGDEKSFKAKVNIEKTKLEAPIKKGTKAVSYTHLTLPTNNYWC
ncbi:hypothetical protein, partial [Bacillus pumilus]|uniref:hypothetical protein n=1 Tax=Bacillus pumilus TaxID=1408 RepID=UPI003703E10C